MFGHFTTLCMKGLMDKIDQVIKRMRWKAFFYMNKCEDTQETDGLKLLNCPPKNQRMGTVRKRFLESCE